MALLFDIILFIFALPAIAFAGLYRLLNYLFNPYLLFASVWFGLAGSLLFKYRSPSAAEYLTLVERVAQTSVLGLGMPTACFIASVIMLSASMIVRMRSISAS